jgi:DNA-binding transcriptional ArsR family regulator
MKSKKELVYQTVKKLTSTSPIVTIWDVKQETGLSYSTVHKWIKILQLEGLIDIERKGGLCNLKAVNDRKESYERNPLV